jgi:MbtH protein
VVTNPFEDPDANYLVLINDEGQHSLWPIFADVPEGWQVIFGEAGRQECLDFIEENWTDMRPKSLIKAMEEDAAARAAASEGNGDGKANGAGESKRKAATSKKGKTAVKE